MIAKILGGLLKRPLLIALIAVVAWGGVQTARLRAERGARIRAELTLVNARASADSTRETLVDGIKVWSRLAMQTRLEADSIDAALGLETRARLTAEVRVAALLDSASSTVVEGDSAVRLTELHTYSEPFTLDVEVEVPPPGRDAIWNYRVELDPITLNARVSCKDSQDTEVRAAEVSIDGPPWANVDLMSVEQEPDICNPAAVAALGETFWSRISIGAFATASISGYWLGGGMACYDGWCAYGGYSAIGTDFGISKAWHWSPF